MSLTDAQLDKLATRRKIDRPKYYSTDEEGYVEILQDTETFMILIPPAANLQAQLYLDQFVNLEFINTDFNDLLLEVIANRESELGRMQDNLDRVMTKYNGMISSLRSAEDDDYDYAQGVQPLMDALNKGLRLFSSLQKFYTYHNLAISAAEERYARKITSAFKKECRSWIRVLSTY